MKYLFHPEAQAEFIQAIEYYEEREKGLGFDFAVEVYAAVERAVAFSFLPAAIQRFCAYNRGKEILRWELY